MPGERSRAAAAAGARAAIVGGGIGGLLAAQVLRRHFGRVTVIERDRLRLENRDSGPPPHRKGAPQGRCMHLLMAGGLTIFERILPGFGGDLARAGAAPFDFGEQAALRFPQGWLPRSRAGIVVHACSRSLLEEVLRRRALADPEVQLLEATAATGLVTDGGRVTGVRVRSGGDDSAADEVLDADLVVVASGTGSTLPSWLAETGLPAPEVTEIKAETHYTSSWFAIPDDHKDDWRFLSIAPAPGSELQSGALFEAEGRRWGAVLIGPKDEEAPSDHAGFLRAAERLADQRLARALDAAAPLSPVHRYGRSPSRIHHYERAAAWPDGLVALGDAVCALDPYFGLGMTACARGVAELEAALTEGIDAPGAARRFQERLAQVNAAPWELATGRDRDGRRDAARSAAAARLYGLALESPDAARAVLERMHMLAPAPEARSAALTSREIEIS